MREVKTNKKKVKAKKKEVNLKPYFIAGVVVVFIILLVLIYKNLFANSDSDRYSDIKNYNLTKEEITSVKEKINTLGDNVSSVDVYVKSKIIRIYIKLKDEINTKDVEKVSDQTIELFSPSNLEYYDLEIFFDLDKESDDYPKIGYKHKSNDKFSW